MSRTPDKLLEATRKAPGGALGKLQAAQGQFADADSIGMENVRMMLGKALLTLALPLDLEGRDARLKPEVAQARDTLFTFGLWCAEHLHEYDTDFFTTLAGFCSKEKPEGKHALRVAISRVALMTSRPTVWEIQRAIGTVAALEGLMDRQIRRAAKEMGIKIQGQPGRPRKSGH